MSKAVPTDKYHSLSHSEELFRALFEHSADAVQLLDAHGYFVYSSDSTKDVVGYKPEEVQGTCLFDYVHPDDVAKAKKIYKQLLKKSGTRMVMEYRVRHKNGSWAWLEMTAMNHLKNPAIHAVVKNFRDITKRKQVEQALAESEARFRFLAEAMPQKIFTATPEGVMDYFNPQWEEYTGIPLARMHSDTLKEIIHPNDYPDDRKSWRRAIQTGEPFVHEHRLRAADGKYRWHLTRTRVMHDEQGNIVMWIGASTDIDDVRQAKKRQRQLEEQTAVLTEQRRRLLELNKAKDEFISLASHQLRTPATGVKQYLGMILEGYAGEEVPPRVRSMVETAYESNDRQLRIVNDILKVAYIDAGKIRLEKQRTGIAALLEEVVQEHATVLQQRSQRIKWAEKDATAAEVDVRLMRMVLENLVDNASKYSEEGKTITLCVRRDGSNLNLLVSISDEGVGMSKEDMKNLFKKFSRLQNPLSALVGGTGLGLYWVKQIVEMHKGKIKVTSGPRKGSTFTVRIPIDAPPD